MKIERFLDWVQKQLLYYPDVSLQTVKLFINRFSECLSKKEHEQHWLAIKIIMEFSNKQITINSFETREIAKKLEAELNNHKNEVNKNELKKD